MDQQQWAIAIAALSLGLAVLGIALAAIDEDR